jgi:NADH-quinone oxidoreductase subunit K
MLRYMITILSLAFLFVISALLILLFKPNLLFVLFSLEILLLGINLNFVLAGSLLGDSLGKFITLILFSVAALDTSVGLIILLNYYNLRQLAHIHPQIKA